MKYGQIRGDAQRTACDPAVHHHRRSIRLRGYDYAEDGAYFVSICTQGRASLFGAVADGEIRPNEAGRMIQAVWDELPTHYPGVYVDAFMIMPNHVHGIIVLAGAAPCDRPGTEQAQGPAPTMSLPDVIHRFKTMTTKRYAEGVKQSGWQGFASRLWQRNYYEHIIRNERSLNRIQEYIAANPREWEFDRENPGFDARAGAIRHGIDLSEAEPWRV